MDHTSIAVAAGVEAEDIGRTLDKAHNEGMLVGAKAVAMALAMGSKYSSEGLAMALIGLWIGIENEGEK